MPTVEDAEGLASALLEPLVNRWAHVQAVAARAHDLQNAAGGESDRQLLVVAAWWHDLGYAPALRDTECHQIDGARFLTAAGYPARLCALVAHHSAATYEAEERGLRTELATWPREESALSDALWMADMTTGPRGEKLTYDQRLAEILTRYDRNSIVGRAMLRAEPAIRARPSTSRNSGSRNVRDGRRSCAREQMER
jgi:HD superfamily phosphodiesterase